MERGSRQLTGVMMNLLSGQKKAVLRGEARLYKSGRVGESNPVWATALSREMDKSYSSTDIID